MSTHGLHLYHLHHLPNIYNTLKNLFIRINPPNQLKSSFVWNYFGHLYKKPNDSSDTGRIYCKICFDKLKDEQPNVTFP